MRLWSVLLILVSSSIIDLTGISPITSRPSEQISNWGFSDFRGVCTAPLGFGGVGGPVDLTLGLFASMIRRVESEHELGPHLSKGAKQGAVIAGGDHGQLLRAHRMRFTMALPPAATLSSSGTHTPNNGPAQ